MLLAETALVFYLLRLNRRKRYDAEIFWQGLFIYSVYRFLIEFVRTNPAAMFGFTHAQLFSLVSGAIACTVLSYYNEQYPAVQKQ